MVGAPFAHDVVLRGCFLGALEVFLQKRFIVLGEMALLCLLKVFFEQREDKGSGGIQTTAQVYSADQGFHRVRQQRGPFAPPRLFFPFTES